MRSGNFRFALFSVAGIALAQVALEPSFEQYVQPFFKQNCVSCHNSEMSTAGVRVDQLDSKLEDRQIPVWEAIRRRINAGTMPPKGLPQPNGADRQRMVEWIDHALEAAR